MQPKLKQLLITKIWDFCEHCTLHGAPYLLRGRSARAAWLAIMAMGLALCATLCHVIWEKYNKDPTVTVVESTHFSTGSIPFPAVSICDPDLVYGPKTGNISNILCKAFACLYTIHSRSRGYEISQIEEFFVSVTDIKKREYVPPNHVKKMHALLEDLGLTLGALHDILKKPCELLMVSCAWRTKIYPCADMFREVHSVVGHCCQFNMDLFRKQAPKNMTFSSGKEPTEGLDIVIDGGRVYSNGTTEEGFALLYIFDAENTITMIDSSITLSPATYLDITMETYAIDSSEDVKALPMRYRKCVLPTVGTTSSYYQQCIATHILQRVIDYCKCVPFEYKPHELGVPDYQACPWERYLCIYERIEKTHADMNSVIKSSECYQKCNYIEYETEVDFIRENQNQNRSMSKNLTRVTVHFGSTTCIKYRRQVLYTWDQMLANLGGIFGLCLGGSLISIIEFAWFLIDLLVTALLGLIKKNNVKPTKKVAFVAQKDVMKKNDEKKDGHYKFVK